MTTRGIYAAPAGAKTVHVRHGVFFDRGKIHVVIPGVEGAHWRHDPGTELYEIYRSILIAEDRWPPGAD